MISFDGVKEAKGSWTLGRYPVRSEFVRWRDAATSHRFPRLFFFAYPYEYFVAHHPHR